MQFPSTQENLYVRSAVPNLAFQPPKFVSGEENLRMLIQSLLGMLLPQKFVTKLKATLDEGPWSRIQ